MSLTVKRRLGVISAQLFKARMTRPFGSSSVPNPLPATFLRGGTSKGIFLNKAHLPSERAKWDPIFLGIMGSPDPEHGRQLNGMGGGVSSLSKICVVAEATPEQKAQDIDVEYTFVQVGIRDSSIDYSGNCGNLSSMIGAYALDEGLCSISRGRRHATVRSFNTNTQKIIDTTFPVSETGVPSLNIPEATVAGVPGKTSQIILDFVNPGGARTGKLLPTGNAVDQLEIAVPSLTRTIKVSLVDTTNPTVFVDLNELNDFLPVEGYIQNKSDALQEVGSVLEIIRQEGARRMGLDPSAQAQPKIAMLSAPANTVDSNIVIHALSMGVLHKAVPMTVGLCLGVASKVQGTIPWAIVQASKTSDTDLVRIRHPGGLVDVGAEFGEDGQVKSAKVVRTGRFLMKGHVFW
ncbi:unnamed protein product [Cyclocybe aegerita]|uniref:DUF453-domain-containing protein n=1 Tax=Cyclocybe aegerita TaxID=1973307 RepID=A0A8S0W7L8_CYCAE|nr:unnamed protein product [Cyclocybe aegerita]